MSAGASRRWGFHRLRPEAANEVVAGAQVRPGQLVVDIGAGDGALTAPLIAAGARVIAVELHPRRAEQLRSRVDNSAAVLTMDLADFHFPGRPHRVVANPPFARTAALLTLLDRNRQIYAVDLVLPRWLVRREVRRSRPRSGWRASEGLVLAPGAFLPRATGACSVLRLRRRPRTW